MRFVSSFLATLSLSIATQAQLLTTKYDQIAETLRQLEKDHPGNASRFELGLNDSGEMIYGIRLGNGPNPQVVVAAHHGNENNSVEVAMATARSLATNPLEENTVYLVPVLNISGFNSNLRRENRIDPNRDYPGPCGSDSGGPFLLKSTKLLSNFLTTKQITAAVTLHTYSRWVLFPWSVNYKTYTKDQATFEKLAQAATAHNEYILGTAADIMYAMHGNFMDYAYWQHGIWSLLFEIGTTHSPNPTQIQEAIRRNVPAVRALLKAFPKNRSTAHAFNGHCPSGLTTNFLDLSNE